MYRRFILLPPTIAFLLLAGCAQAPVTAGDTHDTDIKAIKDTEAAWVQAFNSKDPDKAVSFYSDDATLLVPNEPVVSGKQAVKQALMPLLTDPNFHIQFEAVKAEVAKSGELAYTQGAYTMTLTDPGSKKTATDKGKYLTVFKKQADGSWKAVQDTFSSDAPMPASK
jgi:uncharacterized protein (TIGR02246 family)